MHKVICRYTSVKWLQVVTSSYDKGHNVTIVNDILGYF